MQRSSEFPLFFQTAIAIFSFLLLIAIGSAFTAPKDHMTQSLGTTMEVAKNLKVSY